MPVISSKRKYGGSATDYDNKRVAQHALQWTVETDNPSMLGPDVISGGQLIGPDALPQQYDFFPGDGYSVCATISAKQQTATPLLWDIEAKYTSNYSELWPGNPLLRPAKYNLEFNQFQRPCATDVNGRPILNTLSQMFVPALEAEDSRPTLVIQKNFASLAQIVPLMLQFKDAINSQPFYGASRHQAKIKSITASEEQTENGVRHIPVVIRIEFQGEGQSWDKIGLNAATLFYPPGTTPAMVDLGIAELSNRIDGIEVAEPQPIDQFGALIPRNPITQQLTQAPLYLSFQVYPERDFNLLGI